LEKVPKGRKLFATNHDVGSAQAMIPVLSQLKARGDAVLTFSVQDAPAGVAFQLAGLGPLIQSPELVNLQTIRSILEVEKPDAILVGVSNKDDGSEKLALQAAVEMGIPSLVVLETWPKAWMDLRGSRDIPLYTRASCVCVPDSVSREILLKSGFAEARIAVTGNPCHDDLAEFKRERQALRSEYRSRLGLPQDAVVFLWCVTYDLDDPAMNTPDYVGWLGIREEELALEFLTSMRDYCCLGDPPLHAFLRQKPSYRSDRVRQLIADTCPAVAFDNANDRRGIPALLAADIVAGHSTIVIQTAALLGIPAVYYMPKLTRDDPMVTNALGLTAPMYREGQLRELIRELASDPAKTIGDIRSQMRSMDLPENAAGNVVEEIDRRLRLRI